MKKYILWATIVIVLSATICTLIPINLSSSLELAEEKFRYHCIEHRIDCSMFDGPEFVSQTKSGVRIYHFSGKMYDETSFIFEVRIPMQRWKRTSIGTSGNVIFLDYQNYDSMGQETE